jgi:hypothetical protein
LRIRIPDPGVKMSWIPDPQHCFLCQDGGPVWSGMVPCNVGDPGQQDPQVLGPLGSGSISQGYGSGSFPILIKVLSGLK